MTTFKIEDINESVARITNGMDGLFEAKSAKPSFGKEGKYNYVVNVQGLSSNDFYLQPFGRQMDDLKKIKEFKSSAEKDYIDAKGRSTISAVKEWLKLNKPSQFYAQWQQDSSAYKDDSVEIFYKA
jgi:hypothetical protein